MKLLLTLSLLLASFLPALGATTWPASTNSSQTFFGVNTFAQTIVGNVSGNAGTATTAGAVPASGVNTNSGYGPFGTGAFSAAGGAGVTNNQYLPGVPVANGSGFTNLASANITTNGGYGPFGTGAFAPVVAGGVADGGALTNVTLYGNSSRSNSWTYSGSGVVRSNSAWALYENSSINSTGITFSVIGSGNTNSFSLSTNRNATLSGSLTANGISIGASSNILSVAVDPAGATNVVKIEAGNANTLVVTNGTVSVSGRLQFGMSGAPYIAWNGSDTLSILPNTVLNIFGKTIYMGSSSCQLISNGSADTGNIVTLSSQGVINIGNIAIPSLKINLNSPSVGVSGSLTATNGIVLPSTNAYIKWQGISLYSPPTSGAGSAFLFSATNILGTAEIFTMDGSGTVKQISEHAMDAPPTMLDDADPFPNVDKEWNDYLGKVRWINRSREALVASGVITLAANSYEAWLGIQVGTNTALLANNNVWTTNRVNWAASPQGTTWYNTMKAFIVANAAQQEVIRTETYAAYNTRLGLTNGMPGYLKTASWTNVQAVIQNTYATGFTNSLVDYTNALAFYQTDVLTNTNAVPPVYPTWAPPPVQPVPAWLYTRGVR